MFISLPVEGRIQVRQTGSSTVYPFAAKVAREFSKKSTHICPLVESTSTGNGFVDFTQTHSSFGCDVVGASRQINSYELAACKKAGVGQIQEICIGIGGIALVAKKSRSGFEDLRLKNIYQAVAKKVTNQKGEVVDNVYKKWSDINPKLPDLPICILIPSRDHGTREVFETVIMRGHDIRKGPEVREISEYEAADSHDLLFDFLEHNNAMAFIAVNLLSSHHDHIKVLPIDSINPTILNIQNGTYPLARKVFIYVKESNNRTTEGLQDYVNEWLSPEAIGNDGYLTKMGLVPLLEVKKNRRKL